METYISLLRGINVSGQKKIQMEELKALYKQLKFENILTYIQSGNIIFKAHTRQSVTNITKQIESGITEKFKFNVPVILRTLAEMKRIIDINPLLDQGNIDPEKLYVIFFDKEPAQINIEKLKNIDFLPDKFIMREGEVYLYCVNGYGTSKLNNTFFENKLKISATTRNWRTINKIYSLASEII